MQVHIDHELVTGWGNYISHITTAYDTAYNNQKKMLTDVQSAIIARQQAENALMATALSIITGGLAGALGEGLSRKIGAVERDVSNAASGMTEVLEKAADDPILNKVLLDTGKDLIKKGADKVQDLGLDRLKQETPKSGFEPVGMSPAEYKDLLTQGVNDRCDVLFNFVEVLRLTADSWTTEEANTIKDSLYGSEFFQVRKKPLVNRKDLADTAELALWSVWALARDESYWEKAAALAGYGTGEAFDWAPLLSRLKELGVPADSITILGGLGRGVVVPGQLKARFKQGLDIAGFMDWVRKNLVSTLFDGIPVAPGAHHRAFAKMQQIYNMIQSAA